MKEYTLELSGKNWSAIDKAWKEEKREVYQPPYQAAMNTDIRCLLISEYGEEPYFPAGSNPTYKEIKEYVRIVIDFINDKNLDIDEIELTIEAGVYYREAGFMEYEPTGEFVSLMVATLKLKK